MNIHDRLGIVLKELLAIPEVMSLHSLKLALLPLRYVSQPRSLAASRAFSSTD